jgi:hypothetical protein
MSNVTTHTAVSVSHNEVYGFVLSRSKQPRLSLCDNMPASTVCLAIPASYSAAKYYIPIGLRISAV